MQKLLLDQKHSIIRIVRSSMLVFAVAILCGIVWSQAVPLASTRPDRFVIGRHTFIDVGPPNDFYEVFLVDPKAGGGTSIEKITLTPVTDMCFVPAKVETSEGSINESPSTLLGKTNPCAIPEKELQGELNRRKNFLVFSGANIAMQVQCGIQTRIVRSDILDRDMFDAKPNTPKHTSWTIQILTRLDEVTGPEVLDRPLFPTSVAEKSSGRDERIPTALLDLNSGKYDSLFQGAPDKPSDLYRAAQIPPAVPSVNLRTSTPFQPIKPALPAYPPIAKLAHVEGAVTFRLLVDANGAVSDLIFDTGPPLFRGAVKNAASGWRFPAEAFNQQIQATIDFALNCQRKSH